MLGLQSHMRGCTSSQGAVQRSLSGTRCSGPKVFSSTTCGAMQALRVLINGLSFERYNII